MKNRIARNVKIILALITISGSAATAGVLDFIPGIGDDPNDVLMVTANYAKPRLLAELAQLKKGHPILLVSPEQGGDQLFYMAKYPEARLIPKEKLIDFLAVISPKQIIVLGDEKYVPKKYVTTMRNRYPLSLITGEDWIKNAKALSDAINYKKLVEKYREYLGQLLDEQIKRSDTPAPVNMEERILVP